MDAKQFDHLSRFVARSSSRRSVLALAAALGFGEFPANAGKKNPCKGGCPPCRVCKTKGKKKKCVAAPNGAVCDGGTCQAGTCCRSTCTGLGNVCGPVSNGCGGTVTCSCGRGATPACDNGQCATCATTCPATCLVCVTRINGTTRCGPNTTAIGCLPCTNDVDCPDNMPFCVTASTLRSSGKTFDVVSFCDVSKPGVCASIPPC